MAPVDPVPADGSMIDPERVRFWASWQDEDAEGPVEDVISTAQKRRSRGVENDPESSSSGSGTGVTPTSRPERSTSWTIRAMHSRLGRPKGR